MDRFSPLWQRWARLGLIILAGFIGLGWSRATIRHVAWSAVEFFPPDLARQVRKHHGRFDAGIERGLAAPPAWRAGSPGKLEQALDAQAKDCARDLMKPVTLAALVEQLGVLAVRVLDANDPLAVAHSDPREPTYAAAFQRYGDSVLGRVHLIYYGQNQALIRRQDLTGTIGGTLGRSLRYYHFVGEEFYRGGRLVSWRSFDDRSLAFGVVAISLSHGMTDLADLAAYVWASGGGLVPTPQPTPSGFKGVIITKTLAGGFPDRKRSPAGGPRRPVVRPR